MATVDTCLFLAVCLFLYLSLVLPPSLDLSPQSSRGLCSDKSTDVRCAASRTIAALAMSQAAVGGDKAFGVIKLHDFVDVLKKGLVDKNQSVTEAFARALVRSTQGHVDFAGMCGKLEF